MKHKRALPAQVGAVSFEREGIANHAINLAKTIQGNLQRSLESIGVVSGCEGGARGWWAALGLTNDPACSAAHTAHAFTNAPHLSQACLTHMYMPLPLPLTPAPQDILIGQAKFAGPHTVKYGLPGRVDVGGEVTAKEIIIATGSVPFVPPGACRGGVWAGAGAHPLQQGSARLAKACLPAAVACAAPQTPRTASSTRLSPLNKRATHKYPYISLRHPH